MSEHNKLIVFTRAINPKAYNLLLSQNGVVDLLLSKVDKEIVQELVGHYDRVVGTFSFDDQFNEVEKDLDLAIEAFKANRLTMYEDNSYVICMPIKVKGVMTHIEYYLLEGK